MEEIKNLVKNIVLKAVEKPDEILLYNRYQNLGKDGHMMRKTE